MHNQTLLIGLALASLVSAADTAAGYCICRIVQRRSRAQARARHCTVAKTTLGCSAVAREAPLQSP